MKLDKDNKQRTFLFDLFFTNIDIFLGWDATVQQECLQGGDRVAIGDLSKFLG